MKFEGIIHKYGDDVNTDVIIPARYCNTIDNKELAAHCMEDIDPEFVVKVQTGDILVAGTNFGCGSSREAAPIAIKACGVSCVIAKSFSRIFYRNAINIGLGVFECIELADEISDGDQVGVMVNKGIIHNRTTHKTYRFSSGNHIVEQIITEGGLIPYVQARMNRIDHKR